MRSAIVAAVLAVVVGGILIAGAGDPLGPNASIVIGLVDGAVFGLLALGLVLVYKGTGVFNFAQAEFGTLAAFILFLLIEQWDIVPYGIGIVIAIVAVTGIGLLMERVVIRPLINAPRVTVLVTTIAFALLAIGAEILIFRPEVKELPPLIEPTAAGGALAPEVFGFVIEPQKLLIVLVLIVLGIGLAYFFSRTDLGLAVLATSQDAFATRVVGVGVERMSAFIWGSAAFLGAVAGILYLPTAAGVLRPAAMTQGVLIPAFTAAVIGGMTSLPGAFLGGLVVGLIKGLSQWAAGNFVIGDQLLETVVTGVPDVALMLALLIVLLARPQGLLGKEA